MGLKTASEEQKKRIITLQNNIIDTASTGKFNKGELLTASVRIACAIAIHTNIGKTELLDLISANYDLGLQPKEPKEKEVGYCG